MLISVIVPIYNNDKYLERCINSIVNQTLEDIEIILVDDGSTDNSPAICDKYKKTDNRIKVIHQDNAGVSQARNTGIDIAKGDYIGFIDSDDYIDLNFYETLYKFLITNDADVAIGGMVGNDTVSENGYIHIFERDEIIDKLLPSMLGYNNQGGGYFGISNCKCIFKRSIIEKYNIRYVSQKQYRSEDTIFDIEFYSNANRAVINTKTKYHYCYNGNSLSHKYDKEKFEKTKNLYNYELELIKDFNNYSKYLNRIQSMFLASLRVICKHEAEHISKNKLKNKKEIYFNILNDPLLIKIINEYNYSQLPSRQRVFCFCIKHKLWRLVYILSLLQNRHGDK